MEAQDIHPRVSPANAQMRAMTYPIFLKYFEVYYPDT